MCVDPSVACGQAIRSIPRFRRVRASGEGYAALFNVETTIAGLFRERILPGAFRDTLARDDVRSAFNHDLNQLLGRTSARTLKLTEDAKGLRYVVTVNDKDPNALSVAAKIAPRDVTGSSFWFAPLSDDDEEWEGGSGPGQLPLRTMKRVKLIECGPVCLPAYRETTVTLTDSRLPEALARLRELQARIAREKAWRG